MNPLLKKEIRLILPAWGLTLLLAVAPAGLFRSGGDASAHFMWVVLGVMILCASSFGREFSLGTFSGLLALPCPRRQFWYTKVGVLAAALVSVLLVYWLSLWGFHVVMVADQDGPGIGMAAVLLLAAVAGGLWLALVLRQMVATVTLIFLAPGLLCAPALLTLAHYNAADRTVETVLEGLLLVYSVAGIAGSWLIFRRAEDAPWSGGVINLPGWLTVAKVQPSTPALRRLAPWRALVRKEFQFNRVFLWGMGGLFLLDLGEVGVRFLRRNAVGDLNGTLMALGLIPWVLMPLLIGCTSIADERNLGTLEGQLCQPASARRQFLVKFGLVLLFGGLLSTVLPFASEMVAWAMGVDPELPGSGGLFSIWAANTAWMTALALLAFYASSLSKNLLHALPVAIGTLVVLGLVAFLFIHLSEPQGPRLWHPLLPVLIGAAGFTVALPWLAYRNFRSQYETRRLWWRNGLGLAGVIVFSMVASFLLYHRAWEMLTPFEPAHGRALWSLNQRPMAIKTGFDDNLLLTLPDGRHWFGCLAESQPGQHAKLGDLNLDELLTPPAPQLTIRQFIPGTNWISLAAGYEDLWVDQSREGASRPQDYVHVVAGRETVGIRADGTLWVSAQPSPNAWNANDLVQYGTETNWLAVSSLWHRDSVLLLKTEGTLWCWGTNLNSVFTSSAAGPGLAAQPLRQIGTNADWQAFVHVSPWQVDEQKADGSLWHVWFDSKTGRDVIELNTNLDAVELTRQHVDETKVNRSGDVTAGIRPDGTLWIWGHLHWDAHGQPLDEVLQCSRETNWVAVALEDREMVALKADGTLWKWGAALNGIAYAEAYTQPPVRLGTHQDWVALAQTWEGVVSLAADGSLWLWRDSLASGGDYKLILPSEKPVALGKVGDRGE